MRTLAGGWEITDPCYVDAKENPDRTPAPADEVEAFLAAATFVCVLLAARITPEQCAANRLRPAFYHYPCQRCTQERPKVSGRKKKEKPHGTGGVPGALQQAGRSVAVAQSQKARQAGRQAGLSFPV